MYITSSAGLDNTIGLPHAQGQCGDCYGHCKIKTVYVVLACCHKPPLAHTVVRKKKLSLLGVLERATCPSVSVHQPC
jgi:hypothetical protein